MVLYFLFCCEDCNRIGRNPYYKINDKGRLNNERWGILSKKKTIYRFEIGITILIRAIQFREEHGFLERFSFWLLLKAISDTYFLSKLTPLFRVVCKCALSLFHSDFWILKIKILFLNFSMQILNYLINLSVLFGTSLFLKAFCILDGLFDVLQTF